MAQDTDSSPIRLASELPEASQRFLARVVDQVLQDGWRTPDDFLRHFPAAALVESLAEADELRVKVLVAATGMHERIALKKSISSAGEDLELALEEGATDAASLVEIYPPDDKVRYLDAQKLWEFAVEDEFWKAKAAENKPAHSRAAKRLTFVLETALDEELITLKDIADGMTFHEIATSMPVMELQELVKHALQIARASAPLTEERLLAVVPLSSIVEYVSLSHTWERVVLAKVAAPCGFAEAPASVPPRAEAGAQPEQTGSTPPQATPKSAPPAPAEARPGSDRPPDEDAARQRVIDRLRLMERLPPKHQELSTPILLSIESMYADLVGLTDDEQREAVIRESFPNEAHLRSALLALIELLDPSIDTDDTVIRDADLEGLIKIVLFEERRRSDSGAKPKSSSAPQSPASARRRARSMPPPLPPTSKSGSGPPPLPEDAAAASRRKR